MAQDTEVVPVKVIESYVNDRPAIDYSALTTRLLSTVPEKYLVGLESVVLCNLTEQPRKVRTGTLARRGRRMKRTNLAGLYHAKWAGQRAWIQLFVDQIHMPSRFWYRIRPVRELVFAQVLYHELGHHAHTLRREYREKEDVADDWGMRFSLNHLRRAYWYLTAVIWVVLIFRRCRRAVTKLWREPRRQA